MAQNTDNAADWKQPRKCKQCAKRYTPNKEDQKFCCTPCRRDFHAYGPLTARKVEFVAEKKMGAEVKRLNQLIADLAARVAQLETFHQEPAP